MDDNGTTGLQGFNRLHARDQAVLFLLELLNLFDLLFELADLRGDIFIAFFLKFDASLKVVMHDTPDRHSDARADTHYGKEFRTALAP